MQLDVTASISTKNRYFSTLPAAIISIAQQTKVPKSILIFDDGDQVDLRKDNLYQNIFTLLECREIEWKIIFGQKKGQVLNHQRALEIAQTKWIWRLDDDNIAESNVLETLIGCADEKTGAVGGLVLHPGGIMPIETFKSPNKIEDIFTTPNIQWIRGYKEIIEVDHLYSTFILRREVALEQGYCMDLSPAGHREETLLTYGMKMKGWKILVNPNATTWHLRQNEGGIRSYSDEENWIHDDKIFIEKMNEMRKSQES